MTNPLRAAWYSGRTTCGVWCASPSSVSAEAAAHAGADYVCVDMQHGAVGYSDAVPMLQAVQGVGVTPLVRVASSDAATIGVALDAGALGVVVPMISTPEAAARAVSACRYPPRGVRSFGPIRAAVAVGSREIEALEDVVCAVMVETVDGLARVDEIAATPGLDAIYVGPADLALALGLPPAYERPEAVHREAISMIEEACRRHGITAGIHCADGAMAARRIEEGFKMVTVANDIALVRSGVASELKAARAG